MKRLLISLMVCLLVLGACQSSQNQTNNTNQNQGDNVTVEFSNIPNSSLFVNQSYEFTWRVEGGENVSTNIQASYSKDFFNARETGVRGSSTGTYSEVLNFSETGTVYLRASANVDGRDFTSNTIVKKVILEVEEDNGVSQDRMNDSKSSSSEVQDVELIARQYRFEPSEITVEKGVPVVIHASSIDVDHGIGISAFGVNEVLPVGENVTVRFTPDKTGEFEITCTVYCGTGHSSMTGTLVVE